MNDPLMVTNGTPSKIKQLCLGIACTAVTVALFFGLFLIRRDAYLKGLVNYEKMTSPDYQERSYPGLTARELVNLGSAHSPSSAPASSYLNVPKEKPEGDLRIGFFGCSFTQGYEAAKEHNFPSFVQDLFFKNGMPHVKAINFGVSAYGMHPSYLMWDYLGRDYDLDYVVFMLFDFHMERDSSFIFSKEFYRPVRARFVLEDEQLVLKEVLGDSLSEAAEIYYQTLTDRQYLRYDYQASPTLRSLIPTDREFLYNPFYYQKDMTMEEEILQTYIRLFRRLAGEVEHLILIVHDDFGLRLRDELQAPNISFLKSILFKYSRPFLYRAPKGHRSGLGNQMLAEEVFSFLRGDDRGRLNYIQVSDDGMPAPQPETSAPKPLNHYRQIRLGLEGFPITSFFYGNIKPSNPLHGKQYDFKKHQTQSLLQVSLSKSHFLPLPFLLQKQTEVFVAFRADGQDYKIPIATMHSELGVMGRVKLLASNESGELKLSGEGWNLRFKHGDELRRVRFDSEAKPEDVKIFLGDQLILEEGRRVKKSIYFQPAFKDKDRWVKLRSDESQWMSPDDLKTSRGVFELQLETQDGQVESYPVYLSYERKNMKTEPFLEVLGAPIGPGVKAASNPG